MILKKEMYIFNFYFLLKSYMFNRVFLINYVELFDYNE